MIAPSAAAPEKPPSAQTRSTAPPEPRYQQHAPASFEAEMGVFYQSLKDANFFERQKVLFPNSRSGTARVRNKVPQSAGADQCGPKLQQTIKGLRTAPIDGINLCCHLSACFPSRTPDASSRPTSTRGECKAALLCQGRLRCKLSAQASPTRVAACRLTVSRSSCVESSCTISTQRASMHIHRLCRRIA